MTWILIIMLYGSGAHSSSTEFNSREACEVAMTEIMKAHNNYWGYGMVATCVEKGA